jgi:hypothetical protein
VRLCVRGDTSRKNTLREQARLRGRVVEKQRKQSAGTETQHRVPGLSYLGSNYKNEGKGGGRSGRRAGLC